MASGGIETLPHIGAPITLAAVTGLSHRKSHRDRFAIPRIKTAAGVDLRPWSAIVAT
ncbi:MAG: hypothetical protein HYV17_13420 [Xanthomonadales bacterium]|nr:hypothetical protein [Xanthomonadales bacterium]